MTTDSTAERQPAPTGMRPGVKWAVTGVLALAVLVVLGMLASFVYPWLVAYGLTG